MSRLGPRPLALVLVPLALLLVGARPKKPPANPVPVEAPAPESPSSPPGVAALFPDGVPIDPGGLPAGLANLSAQGCAACHVDTHAGWAASAHHRGHRDPDFAAAAHQAATPACLTCHLPLRVQHPDRVTFEDGDPSRPVTAPNDAFDATLATEGVTCAACHVRDGRIVAGRPDVRAPHATTWSAELGKSTMCAACHQLAWPGADVPIYDTYGEWERSAYAKAGIQCQDCHMRGGVGTAAPDHTAAASPARAVSLLVDVDRVAVTRGGPALDVALRVQNTGAGHAFPTGAPSGGVRLEAALVGPVGKKGELGPYGAVFTADFARVVEAAPPYRTTADTRLLPGAEASFRWQPALDDKAPPGPWTLRVTLSRTLAGRVEADPFVVQEIALRVD